MPVLTSQQRKLLDDACVKGRRTSEQAVRAALGSLAVTAERPPAHLSGEDRQLRRGLRAKSRQLGDQGDKLDLLIGECAYEQWHRLLFARFLAENNLLIHPEYRAPVTLEDCEELSDSLGELDGWSVAGRFAAEILPGIFRLDDPRVQLRLPPEGRLALEAIVAGLPVEIFRGDEALGWVYQYWQREQKDEVNASERKVGGADLAPVTQLFTENYMVRFLLENSLGAWWAARHPKSPLLAEWKYLRRTGDDGPETGSFESWPGSVAQVTLMDPCCGSGHFLVEAFEMLWRMRVEEEQLATVEAQDAVLRENLFGLELDPRCVQIAMFAVALQAWKSSGGWRPLPIPNIACSGIPVKAAVGDWKALANGDQRLENALERLHILFRDADTLGSLIDPQRTTELSDPTGLQTSLDDVEWEEVSPILQRATNREESDPAVAVLRAGAAGTARAADLLARHYTLVATNVPYLERRNHSTTLLRYVDAFHAAARFDLATAFVERAERFCSSGGSAALVVPQNWLFLTSYARLRQWLLSETTLNEVVWLGPGAFGAISGEVVKPVLLTLTDRAPGIDSSAWMLDVSAHLGPVSKAEAIASASGIRIEQRAQLSNAGFRILAEAVASSARLGDRAISLAGMMTSDSPRFVRYFWELPERRADWEYFQSTSNDSLPYSGLSQVLYWQQGVGIYRAYVDANRDRLGGAPLRGRAAWGKRGVAISQMGLNASLYCGSPFDNNVAVLVPNDPEDLNAIWAFCRSPEFPVAVRVLDRKMNVTNATLGHVAFDLDHWTKVADEAGPLPEPWSDDPTQWLFDGRPEVSTSPLQVAVARLVGYRWPEQRESDDLDALADADGIVCLPSVRGERTAAQRLQELLARAFGGTWSPARTGELLTQSGSKGSDFDRWLRDEFFKGHCQLFRNNPFVWQMWDERKDGFSALVNCHRMDRATVEKLTYSYLGDWIERQVAAVRDDVPGAEERLAAARTLQQKLESILTGEPPYDIYVRWKSLAEQPIGWEPDLNDGVRLNIRPFVEAGILRSKVNVKWDKDRGKNPDGSDRLNNLHYTNAQKQAARGASA